jgi:hypothetical protein
MLDAEAFLKAVHPLLKSQDFKRSNSTWRKIRDESIAVFNVQKSSWGGGVYYVNVGVYFCVLGDDLSPTENKCHVRLRLELGDPSAVVSTALEWFQARSTFRAAAALAESDSRKGLVFKELRSGVGNAESS